MTKFSDLIIPDLTSDCQKESKLKSRTPILSLCYVFCSIFLLHKLLCKNQKVGERAQMFAHSAGRPVGLHGWGGCLLPHLAAAPGCRSPCTNVCVIMRR